MNFECSNSVTAAWLLSKSVQLVWLNLGFRIERARLMEVFSVYNDVFFWACKLHVKALYIIYIIYIVICVLHINCTW